WPGAARARATAGGTFVAVMKIMRDTRVAATCEQRLPDDLRETAQPFLPCLRIPRTRTPGNARRPSDPLPRDAAVGDQPSSSTSAAYASGSSRSLACSGSLASITNNQPSPNASSLIVSGLSASDVFTAAIVPDTGA